MNVQFFQSKTQDIGSLIFSNDSILKLQSSLLRLTKWRRTKLVSHLYRPPCRNTELFLDIQRINVLKTTVVSKTLVFSEFNFPLNKNDPLVASLQPSNEKNNLMHYFNFPTCDKSKILDFTFSPC